LSALEILYIDGDNFRQTNCGQRLDDFDMKRTRKSFSGLKI